jgi:MFS family permease
VIIWAKLSDIYGRKPFILAALFIFTVFSGACGAAQTMTQLYAFSNAHAVLGANDDIVLSSVAFKE